MAFRIRALHTGAIENGHLVRWIYQTQKWWIFP